MSDYESSTAVDELELSEEERSILRWRYEQLRRLGLSQVESRLLADVGVDLNLLRRLIGSGCPPTLAARIAL